MLDKFIKYYTDAKELCIKFNETLSKINLDSEHNFPEIYIRSSINLVENQCNSITALLKENEFGSVIMICRNLMEMFFNLHWAIEPIDTISNKTKLEKAIKDRFYKLQGTPFNSFEKVLVSMEKHHNKQSTLKPNTIKETRELIENVKQNYSFLLTKDEKGNPLFKKAPPFAERMGNLKNEHYHVYSFTSIFIHPTPIISTIYFPNMLNIGTKSINVVMQILSSGLFYVHAIVGYGNIAFDNLKFNEIRKKCYLDLSDIFQQSQNDLK